MLLPIYQVIAKHCLREVVECYICTKFCYKKLGNFNSATNISGYIIAEHCLREAVVNSMYKLCYNKLGIFIAATNISGYSRTLIERSCGQIYVHTLLHS